jgi:hypothetical protein
MPSGLASAGIAPSGKNATPARPAGRARAASSGRRRARHGKGARAGLFIAVIGTGRAGPQSRKCHEPSGCVRCRVVPADPGFRHQFSPKKLANAVRCGGNFGAGDSLRLARNDLYHLVKTRRGMGNARPAAPRGASARWAGPMDIAIKDGRIVEMAAQHRRRGGGGHRRHGPPGLAPLRRSAFPHGRDAEPRPAAAERLRHAAGGNRALGGVEAAPDGGGGGRAGAALLRPCGGAGASGDPEPRGRLDRAAGGCRGALGGQEKPSPRISTCNSWPSRRTGSTAPRARRRT